MSIERMCACGRPLHYSNPANQAAVQRVVDDLGECIPVRVGNQQYQVPRHFIALHGLKAEQLPTLAQWYGFPRTEVTDGEVSDS